MKRWHLIAGCALTAATAVAATLAAVHAAGGESPARPVVQPYDIRRADHPARSLVYAQGVLVATLTDGARTVDFRGPQRTLTEARAAATVVTDQWIRIAPRPWSSQDADDPEMIAWIRANAGSAAPDVLQIATEYLRDAPVRRDDKGQVYAGDAAFGIEREAGVDGADFHEYMGIPWTFPDGHTVAANPRWREAMDCSGFVRMVYGYRSGLPLLTGATDTKVDGLPRTAESIAYHARSAVIAAGSSHRRKPSDLGEIQPGDLVFFAMHSDPAKISHTGIYIGSDVEGRPRFASSRASTKGPSFGDSSKGRSTLDEPLFAKSLRRVVRL